MNTKKSSQIVRQSNRLINFSPAKMGLREKRVFLSIIAMLSPEEDGFREYKVNLMDVLSSSGTKDPALYSKARELADNLMSRQVFSETRNADGKRVYEKFQLLSRVRYIEGKGYFSAWIDPGMKDFLLGLKRDFTEYGLEDALKLRTLAGLRLYELLAQFKDTGWRQVEVNQLRHLLGLIDYDQGKPLPSRYPRYGGFKKYVIDHAVTDINSRDTALQITEVEEIKDRRKVTALKFHFKFTAPVPRPRTITVTKFPASARKPGPARVKPTPPDYSSLKTEEVLIHARTEAASLQAEQQALRARWDALPTEEQAFFLERARRLIEREGVTLPEAIRDSMERRRAMEILQAESA